MLRGTRGRRHGVGEDDDRRFQTLGGVNRHDADLVARDLHVALHVGLRGAEPGDEALQGRSLSTLIVERDIEKFLQGVIGLGTATSFTNRSIASASK